MPFRIGLMGCGTVAGYGHLPALQAVDGLQLAALYDPDAERLAAAAGRFGVEHAVTDVDAFFDAGLDAVAITSPAPVHADNLRAAAERGVHVLCEKPLAMTEAEAGGMIDTAHDAGILLAVGFTARFNPVSQEIRRLVADNAVGQVRALRLIYTWGCHGKYETGPDGQRREQARRAGRMHEGGPLVDCGVHDIDLARWWLGREVSAWTAAGAWVDEYEAPDHVWLHMDHEGGAHTMVEISFSYTHTAADPVARLSYELIGAGGVIRYDMGEGLLEVRDTAGTRRQEMPTGKNFEGMYAAFAQTLDSGQLGDLASGEDGLAATRITRAATERVIAERPVRAAPPTYR